MRGRNTPPYNPKVLANNGKTNTSKWNRIHGMADKASTYPPLPLTLPSPVYDSHTHLAPGTDYKDQLDRAEAVNVIGVLQVGTDVNTSHASVELAMQDQRILAAVAIHPNDAADIYKKANDATHRVEGQPHTECEKCIPPAKALEKSLTQIANLAGSKRVRAIGETGLDYFRTQSDLYRAAQRFSFDAHIQIAKEHNLALQIHDRDAHQDVIECLLRAGAPDRTIFHCFSGDEQMLEICIKNGWYMSCSGIITFKNAREMQKIFAKVPKELLLVETDAPFLTPSPFRGFMNSSYMLAHTVRTLAEIRQENIDQLCTQLSRNTCEIFGKW
ncbi:TatD family hydrolase [Tropheryma whipplei]|uniref:TatD family hydrolase n=2 Tax=Tropheryma whipplei TaxID=2039 RepID=UPI0004B5CABC|nr:TatD family hydrolase [Tropheryma whipplei]